MSGDWDRQFRTHGDAPRSHSTVAHALAFGGVVFPIMALVTAGASGSLEPGIILFVIIFALACTLFAMALFALGAVIVRRTLGIPREIEAARSATAGGIYLFGLLACWVVADSWAQSPGLQSMVLTTLVIWAIGCPLLAPLFVAWLHWPFRRR